MVPLCVQRMLFIYVHAQGDTSRGQTVGQGSSGRCLTKLDMIGPEKFYPEHRGESLGWGRDKRERKFPTGSCMLLGEVLSLGY